MSEFEVDFGARQRFELKGFRSSDPFKVDADGEVAVGGTADYEKIRNKPKIESVELVGDRKLEEFGMTKAQNTDILGLFR